jgi:hypothetical protein
MAPGSKLKFKELRGWHETALTVAEQDGNSSIRQMLGDEIQVPVAIHVGKKDLAGSFGDRHRRAGHRHEQRRRQLPLTRLIT